MGGQCKPRVSLINGNTSKGEMTNITNLFADNGNRVPLAEERAHEARRTGVQEMVEEVVHLADLVRQERIALAPALPMQIERSHFSISSS